MSAESSRPPSFFFRFTHIFTYLISPPTIFAALGFALAWAALPFWDGLIWGTIYGVLITLIPLLFVVYLLKTGRVKTLNMTREERRIPYAVAVFCAFLAAFIFYINGPDLLFCLTLVNIIGLGAMGLVNLVWKISNHATAIASGVLVLGAVFGSFVGWLFSPLIILVCAARVYLRYHTPTQTLAGIVLGLTTVIGLLLTGCFSG